MIEKHQGCRFLDYDEAKFTGSGCELIKGEDGLWWWKRPEHYPGAPTIVQFCQKRGRINQVGACWEPGFMGCYEAQDERGDEFK